MYSPTANSAGAVVGAWTGWVLDEADASVGSPTGKGSNGCRCPAAGTIGSAAGSAPAFFGGSISPRAVDADTAASVAAGTAGLGMNASAVSVCCRDAPQPHSATPADAAMMIR